MLNVDIPIQVTRAELEHVDCRVEYCHYCQWFSISVSDFSAQHDLR